MPQEKEIKIALKLPLSKFRKRLEARGFKQRDIIKQEDIYFDTPEWNLYESLAALRARKVNGQEQSFSFKKMFYLPKRRNKYFIEEIQTNFPLTDISILRRIFDRIKADFSGETFGSSEEAERFLNDRNFFGEQRMFKTREIYRNKANEVTIDNVDHVGITIELECQNDEPLDIVNTILDKDEWKRSIEGTSYVWLKNVKGLDSHIRNLKRFKKEPDWNVWENEKEMYQRLARQ